MVLLVLVEKPYKFDKDRRIICKRITRNEMKGQGITGFVFK